VQWYRRIATKAAMICGLAAAMTAVATAPSAVTTNVRRVRLRRQPHAPKASFSADQQYGRQRRLHPHGQRHPLPNHTACTGYFLIDCQTRLVVTANVAAMPSPVRLVRSGTLSDVAEYAYGAVVAPGATVVFAAGACPIDDDGNTVSPGDYAAQARQMMRNLEIALREAGAELADVVRTTVYVASSSQPDLGTAWQVVRDAFGDHDPPSTLLGVTVLGYTDQLVEIDAIAAV
jgi:enamine deaminase RidA (YjgF/YER057c/UK114 family)